MVMEIGTKLLACPLCSFPHFKDVHVLRSTLISVATTQLSCPVCNASVMGIDKLTIHLFSHMNDNLNHIKESSSENTLFDDNQDQHFPSLIEQDNLKELNVPPITSKEDSMICDICNFTFSDRSILELHQKLLHQTDPDKETGSSSFHCHLCSKKFKMRGSLIVHLRVAHYRFSTDTNNVKTIVNRKLQTYDDKDDASLENGKLSCSKLVDNKQWECEGCSKMFTTKYFLKKHMRLHTGEMPYTCNQCNKSFTFQQSYHKHMLYHSSEKPHLCNECGRAFKELSTLQNHARIHSGERPFGCETCGKRFRQRVSYLVHRRIHTGVMPYDCKSCGKKFRYKVSQRSHKCDQINTKTETSPIAIAQFSPSTTNDQATNVPCFLAVDHDGKISLIKKDDSSTFIKKVEFEKHVNMDIRNVTYSKSKTNNNDNQIFGASNSSPDLYSMIMSPLLPEVESLCLSNSPTTNVDCDNNHCQEYFSSNLFNNTNFSETN